jgi:hypothetical protein
VYVNPQEPAQAVIDRDVRWKLVMFLTPFALGFGGVGVGALWMLPRVLRDSPDKDRPKEPKPLARTVSSNMRGGMLGVWLFAFFWNAISMPVAFMFVPEKVREGEWAALIVLIFPLVGVLLLVYAIKSTVGYLLRGGAVLEVLTAKARVGAPLQGSVAFSRGVAVGDAFRVKLECVKTDRRGEETSTDTLWTREAAVQAVEGPRGPRVDFRFDIPSTVPATTADSKAEVANKWRVEVQPASPKFAMPYGFDVALAEAPPETAEFAFSNDAPVPAEVQQMFERLGVNATEGKKRAAFAELPQEQQAALVKFARWVPSMKKIAIVIVCIVAMIQFGPVLIDLIRLVKG